MFKRALIIGDVPTAFQPKPLEISELDSFHVKTDNVRDSYISFLDELRKKLETQNSKILFAGHRGSGKTTELNRLKKKIENKYFIITFSIRDELDMYNINYIDLIFLFMEKVFSKGKEAGYLKNEKLMKNLHSWLTETTKIKVKETAYGMELAAGIKTGGGIVGNIIGLLAEAKSHLKLSGKTQTVMREKIEPKINDLKNYCNLLINELEMALRQDGKNLLIIVEDADKLELVKARDIFYNHSGILSEINTRIIFSIHIFLLNSPYFKSLESKYERITFPMIKINNPDGTSNKEGREILKAIIEKRMDLSIIEGEALNQVIEKSGGNLRDLFEIIENGAMSAKYQKNAVIDMDKINYGTNKVKADYNRSLVGIKEMDFEVTTKELYERLVKIHKEEIKSQEMDAPFLVLLNAQAVLEYNGEQWFDIHPVVIDLLKDMKKI